MASSVEKLMEQLRREREEKEALQCRLLILETQGANRQETAAGDATRDEGHGSDKKREQGRIFMHAGRADQTVIAAASDNVPEEALHTAIEDGIAPGLAGSMETKHTETRGGAAGLKGKSTALKRKAPETIEDPNQAARATENGTANLSTTPTERAPIDRRGCGGRPKGSRDKRPKGALVVIGTATSSTPTSIGNAASAAPTPTTQLPAATTSPRPRKAAPSKNTAKIHPSSLPKKPKPTPAQPTPTDLVSQELATIDAAFRFATSWLCPMSPDPDLAAALNIVHEDAKKDEVVRGVLTAVLREEASTVEWAKFKDFVVKAKRIIRLMEEEERGEEDQT